MENPRRHRFVEWFKRTYKDGPEGRAKFLRDTGLSKGRLTQLFDPAEPFGEAAARKLALKIGKPATFFDGGAAPDDLLPLRDDIERELLIAFRLIFDVDKADVLAKTIQLALERNPGIARMMEMAGVSKRADDESVLRWWHQVQASAPREAPPSTPPRQETTPKGVK